MNLFARENILAFVKIKKTIPKQRSLHIFQLLLDFSNFLAPAFHIFLFSSNQQLRSWKRRLSTLFFIMEGWAAVSFSEWERIA